jgi:nucleoside-diphosphate-sugar epimerase
MQSNLEGPVNIGGDEHVTVTELVDTVIEVSGKQIRKKYVEGPVGVQARNFDKARIKTLGWEAKTSLREGITRLYPWIEAQVGAVPEAKRGRRKRQ